MNKAQAIIKSKELRVKADAVLQEMKQFGKDLIGNTDNKEAFLNHSETIANNVLSFRDLESCIMRQGMVLKNIGQPTPYPSSYDPTNTKVEPTADGLKL